MIISLTLNPAVDIALSTKRIVFDDRSIITQEIETAGGKGINAAKVIHSYGGKVLAITVAGGWQGERFIELLKQSGMPVDIHHVAAETRRNVSITDNQGLTIKLDQQGEPLSADEVQQTVKAVEQHLPEASWFMLTGSLQQGMPTDIYAKLIEKCKQHNVPVLLDSSGPALAAAIACSPALVKPNRIEAEKLLGKSLLTQGQALLAAVEIQQLGAERVILSLGSQGIIAVGPEGRLRVAPPSIETGCPIGAGDVLAATCLWAMVRGESFEEALRWGVASSTVAASLPGLAYGQLDEVSALREKVEIQSL